MNIGLLPDGSLSSRLKGDIYWKIQKLMLRSAQDIKGSNPATDHFLSKFQMQDDILGNDTFTSMDTLRDTHARPSLSSATRPTYNANITEKRLMPAAIEDFGELIPENYISQIKNASLTVKSYYDSDRFLGLSITGVHSDWMELVWVSPDEDTTDDELASLVALIIDRARAENKYKGFFVELHMSPHTPQMEEILRSCGMQTVHVKNNLYEFTYGDIDIDRLAMAAMNHPCTPLSQASDEMKSAVEDILYDEKTPVPVALPIPWSKYRQDLSMLHYSGKPSETGLYLVSEMGDTLIIELLYGKSPLIVAAILGDAFVYAKDIIAPSQKILVPIVLEATRPLIERFVPDATREDLVEAFVRF